MKIILLSSIGVLCVVGAVLFYLNRIQMYHKQQLDGVKLEKENDDDIIFIPLPLESVFTPVLVEFRKEENTVVVTVYKQLRTPWQGIYRSLIHTDVLKESFVKYDSHRRPRGGFVAKIEYFGLKTPKILLRTVDGDIVLLRPL